nr:ankyrin repeat and zinc finger domain-containing protein 1 [Ipomoea batatas]
MATEPPPFATNTTTASTNQRQDTQQKLEAKRHRCIFELPSDFFDSCLPIQSPFASSLPIAERFENLSVNTECDVVVDQKLASEEQAAENNGSTNNVMRRWSCNTCKAEFESLQDQRSHFKSDIHRLNIKLSIAGKDTLREEDFDDGTSDSLCKDYDVSSISASDDDDDRESVLPNDLYLGLEGSVKNKIFIKLQTGEVVSLWRSLLLNESEHIVFENDRQFATYDSDVVTVYWSERGVVEKLKCLLHEPRNNTQLRIVLLARGGHFAGCVFDGKSVVAHKTFHRYVIRAKAGRKQSSKDASGKMAHSAGASLRRHNELALKKEIQELLAEWKPYFTNSSSVFIYAPSNNRQLFFDGNKPFFACQHCAIKNVPLTVRRPTFKEARRIYNLLTRISFEVNEEAGFNVKKGSLLSESTSNSGCSELIKEELGQNSESKEIIEPSISGTKLDDPSISSQSESENDTNGITTPLHDAAKSGDAQKVLELLEQGMDPCIKDERGRTPYMLATEKEVRNTFRRFMASNVDKWDWNAAKVPSPLTKEMEDSQAAKQAEKDAKRKARAKELKKLRKARQKKAQAEANEAKITSTKSEGQPLAPVSAPKGSSQSRFSEKLSREEELKRAQDAEREKRAAAAERRIAAAAALKPQSTTSASVASNSSASETDILCSCCNASLAGKVPFHRYNYKYCSSSCMHVHREILEDG